MPNTITQAVEKIWTDLCDRRGIGNELEACDLEIQKEIKQVWRDAISEVVNAKQRARAKARGITLMKPSDCYFEVDDSEDGVSIMLTPRAYWDEHHCFDDQHIAGEIEGLPDDWEEIMEATFVVEGFEDDVLGLRDLALRLGFVPVPEG